MNTTRPIYLDHGATSFPKAPGVSDAMVRFLARDAGNPGRGGHRLTVAASRSIESARERVADLLGCDPERTLLGPGATFWLNTVLAAWLGPGDRVVTSSLEHNSVMRPLRRLQRDRELDVVIAKGMSADAVPEPEEIRRLVADSDTRLVVLSHASNVTGAILPVFHLLEALRRSRARDGAEVFDQILAAHTDAVVGQGERSGFLIARQNDRQIGVGGCERRVGQRQITQAVAGIRCVGDKLAQKDFLVRIERVGDDVEQPADFSLEGQFFFRHDPSSSLCRS